jgi:hypothetical protein
MAATVDDIIYNRGRNLDKWLQAFLIHSKKIIGFILNYLAAKLVSKQTT